MGRLLIFAGVILVVVGLLALWGFFLKNRENAEKAGLLNSKRRIKELEAGSAQKDKALREIRELAASSEIVTGDPVWSMVITKVDEALEQESDK